MAPRLLIVDPDYLGVQPLEAKLRLGGVEVSYTSRGREALDKLLEGEFDALLCEIVLDDLGGRDLLLHLLATFPGFPVWVRTKFPRVEDAFELAKLGVRGYFIAGEQLTRVADAILEELLGPASEEAEISGEGAGEEEEEGSTTRKEPRLYSNQLSRNRETRDLFRTALGRVAEVNSTVLIMGESGTGKEVLARAIHLNSPRAKGPWVAVNCSALPESLIESELFGHEKGAFTGALKQRIGRFEQASGGTLFLDEVGDLSLAVQAKLLRVLQERTIERIGGSEAIRVDIRVIAATHRDLKRMIEKATFREDLYYRLGVIPLHLPPLRSRPEDIPGLASFFVERFRRETGRPALALTPDAMAALKRHPWPGNIRELENVIERAVVLVRGEGIGLADLPESVRTRGNGTEEEVSLRDARASFERDFILRALRLHQGNVSATADAIGLARKNLQQKIRQHTIDVNALRDTPGA